MPQQQKPTIRYPELLTIMRTKVIFLIFPFSSCYLITLYLKNLLTMAKSEILKKSLKKIIKSEFG